jgi:hypothetical protein
MSIARRSVAVLGVLAVVVGTCLLVLFAVVDGQILRSDFYARGLSDADAYRRVYSDVLADPELGELKADLLGDVDLRLIDPETARVLTTNALRWVVPPDTLQDATEAFLDAVIAYIRGDVEQLDGDVAVAEVLDRIDATAVREARAALASVPEELVTSVAGYRQAVADLVEELRAGVVPESVPVAGDSLADRAVVDAVLAALPQDALAEDAELGRRVEILAHVAAGNDRDALITALTPAVQARASAADQRLRGAIEDRRELDVVAEIGEHARTSRARVVAELDTVRDAARVRYVALAGGIVLVLAGAGSIASSHRGELRRGFLVLGWSLLAGGIAALVLWNVVRHGIDSPLGAATATGTGSWDLPTGLRGVISDVEENLGAALRAAVIRAALVPTVIGAAFVGGAVAVAWRPGTRAVPRLAIAAGVGLVAAVFVWTIPAPGTPRSCNGHPELCDRPYDEVVQVATHNSMSSPDVVFVWPEHDGTIREQLDDGVRALLIDTHYWPALVSPEQLSRADDAMPADLAAALIEQVGERAAGRDGAFLCHNHCALGGAPLVEQLEQVRSFLEDNPDDVVTLIIQDAITSADTEAAFVEAGLEPYVHVPDADAGWPTLADLIDRRERLVVFAEEESPPPAWYESAFDHIQETPYLFTSPDELSCAVNRGPADASLFLVNHWITRTAPDRTDAVVVNTSDAIVARARECELERGQLPDFIAVNFYEIGDTVAAVDILNGVADE